ncbi:MAG: glycoside hydrolase family 16 protein [Verrucomicrobiota bacterium]
MKTGTITSALLITCLTALSVGAQSEKKGGKEQVSSGVESKSFQSQLPSAKSWRLIWNDEFDGKQLDSSKWGYRLHLMQTRHETWTEDGAEFDGKGNLLLGIYEKDGQFYSSHLQTGQNYLDRPGNKFGKTKFVWPVAEMEPAKFAHKYGYYEIRCKLPTQKGWWAAFWLQSPVIGSSLKPGEAGVEMDIMENFTRDGVISHNLHWNGYGKNHEHAGSGKLEMNVSDGKFHTYGLHWSREGYVFYVDGKVSWKVDGPVSDREQFILISTEVMGYRNGAPSPLLKNAVLPDYFVVDYVRVFDEIGENVEK